MKSLGNYLLWAIIGILAFPSVAILATWNAVPGDSLYPVKRNLEKIAAVIVSPSYKARSELELRLVDRRLDENNSLLSDRTSSVGLTELTAQAKSAEAYVLASETSVENKTAAAKKLVVKLAEANTKLEEKQQQLVSEGSTSTTASGGSTTSPTSAVGVSQPVETTTPSSKETPEEVIDQIEQTQEEIENIIDEIEQEAEVSDTQSFDENEDEPEDDKHEGKGKDQAPGQQKKDDGEDEGDD